MVAKNQSRECFPTQVRHEVAPAHVSRKPLVSVVMPNYNSEKYLRSAIQSILQQTFHDFEFIIVDDASTDASLKILKEYAACDHRIVLLQNEGNQKICHSLNRGVERALGNYIVRMDSDDIALPERIEKQVAFMEMPENQAIGVCGSFVDVIDENGRVSGVKRFPLDDHGIRQALWFRNPIPHSATIIRRECFEILGLYDHAFLYSEDLELWMRFGQRFLFHNLPEVLLQYRIHGGNAVLKRQKHMILTTLKVRAKAAHEYGYHMPISAKMFFITLFLVAPLPAGLVFQLFTLLRRRDGVRGWT